MTSTHSPDHSQDPRADIDTILTRFKRRGCTLLVTGSVDETIAGIATRRLLGAPECSRKRLLVFSDATFDYVDYCLPGGTNLHESHNWVMMPGYSDQRTDAPSCPNDINECDLAHVHREITHAISHFEQATGGLAPAELRIGIASLADFLQVNDLDAVTQFLHQWADLVREVNGMGHVRFPIPDSSELVETLAPLFDARIELRQQGMEPPEQRWHIPQHDITTAWTTLE